MAMKEIYLDNSATTAVSAAVAQIMNETATQNYGNPSSVHARGLEAQKTLSAARMRVLSAMGIKNPRPETLIFTGSGTEADNLALIGTYMAKPRKPGANIVISDGEHPAIDNSAKFLHDAFGCEVRKLKTRGGVIDPGEVAESVDPNTVLISVMTVNNETGAIYDVKSIFDTARTANPNVICHTDAVQGFMKLPLNPTKLGADLMTVSAHKINGPKGVGALYVDPAIMNSRKIVPIIHGGGQERGFRSGTENLVCIAGFGAAAMEKTGHEADDTEIVRSLRSELVAKLPDGVVLNVPEGEYLPHIASLTLPGIKSEIMVRFLSERGICISAGSACSSHDTKTSKALLAFGISNREADCTVRVSMSSRNTSDEISEFCDVLGQGIARLQRVRR